MIKRRICFSLRMGLLAAIVILASACTRNTGNTSLKRTGPDSLYTEKHIIGIFLNEPQRALLQHSTYKQSQGNLISLLPHDIS